MKFNFLKSNTTLSLAAVIGLTSCSKDSNSSYNPQPPTSKATIQLVNDAELAVF